MTLVRDILTFFVFIRIYSVYELPMLIPGFSASITYVDFFPLL